MKTKSLLFAALVSISLATTSCQKEENIAPSIGYYSNDKSTAPTEILDGDEVLTNETQGSDNVAKPRTNQPKVTPPTNIMQIDSDEIK